MSGKPCNQPKLYAWKDILACISQSNIAMEAWQELTKVRTAEAVSLLELILTAVANQAAYLAAIKRTRAPRTTKAKRFLRMARRLERAACEVEFAIKDRDVNSVAHGAIEWHALPGPVERIQTMQLLDGGFFGTSGHLRLLAQHIRAAIARPNPKGKQRLKDWLAGETIRFLWALRNTGDFDPGNVRALDQASYVLQPIYRALGLCGETEDLPNAESLRDLIRRHPLRAELPDIQRTVEAFTLEAEIQQTHWEINLLEAAIESLHKDLKSISPQVPVESLHDPKARPTD